MQHALQWQGRIPAPSIPLETEPTVTIDGLSVSCLTRDELTAQLKTSLRRRTTSLFCYANVHAANVAHDDPDFLNVLNRSDVLYCDGMGLRYAGILLRRNIPQRIALTDWVDDVMSCAEQLRVRVYLLGGAEGVADAAAQRLRMRYPRLRIAGWHHGYLTDESSAHIVREVNRLNVDLLIVGMGMPLQERWIARVFDQLPPATILTAGSCLEYLSGNRSRCPMWMSRSGLEWLFRLLQEPRRLWRRYLIGNPRFLFRILLERLSL